MDLRLHEDLVERRERVRLRLHREGVLHLEGDRVRVSVGVLHLEGDRVRVSVGVLHLVRVRVRVGVLHLQGD